MRKDFLLQAKATFPLIIGSIFILFCDINASAQYYLANQKDDTHPEITASRARPSFITGFRAEHGNGYNEINWMAAAQEDSRKFVIEYSFNGLEYQTAGEVICNTTGRYTIKHTLLDERPTLYRVRIETLSGQVFYSVPVLLDGVPVDPVLLYPTILTGNTVNVVAALPVTRVSVVSASGNQVYVKETGGQRDRISVVLPQLSKGNYWMVFYGDGWKSSSKFIIP